MEVIAQQFAQERQMLSSDRLFGLRPGSISSIVSVQIYTCVLRLLLRLVFCFACDRGTGMSEDCSVGLIYVDKNSKFFAVIHTPLLVLVVLRSAEIRSGSYAKSLLHHSP
jgi:hypothetical protein